MAFPVYHGKAICQSNTINLKGREGDCTSPPTHPLKVALLNIIVVILKSHQT